MSRPIGKENIAEYNQRQHAEAKKRREELQAAGICVRCRRAPIDRSLSIQYCTDCAGVASYKEKKKREKAGPRIVKSKSIRLPNGRYTWPGQPREDAMRCLACKWHGIMENKPCCNYSQYLGNGIRGCPTGVACTKYTPQQAKVKMYLEELDVEECVW